MRNGNGTHKHRNGAAKSVARNGRSDRKTNGDERHRISYTYYSNFAPSKSPPNYPIWVTRYVYDKKGRVVSEEHRALYERDIAKTKRHVLSKAQLAKRRAQAIAHYKKAQAAHSK